MVRPSSTTSQLLLAVSARCRSDLDESPAPSDVLLFLHNPNPPKTDVERYNALEDLKKANVFTTLIVLFKPLTMIAGAFLVVTVLSINQTTTVCPTVYVTILFWTFLVGVILIGLYCLGYAIAATREWVGG